MIESEFTPVDKAEVDAISTLASRLFIARDICKLKRIDAAQLLNISDDDLKKYESGISVDSVPLSVIKRAAQVYDVAADWLLALSEDWETDDIEIRKQRDFLSVMERLHVENYAKTVANQLQQDKKIEVLSDAAAVLGPAIKAIDDAFMAFWEKNQYFADMPGGSTVLHRIDQANAAAQEATRQLVRFKCAAFDALQACTPKTENQFQTLLTKPSGKPLPTPPSRPGARCAA